MELKVSDIEAIKKFADSIINNPNYKDKGKPPEKMFYEIWGSDGKRIGAARKSVLIEDIQKELVALGEGKYSLQDAETKLEVQVYNENNKKEEPKKTVSDKVDSKALNERETGMDEKRTIMDVMKDNGKAAGDKIFHGAKMKVANKTFEAVALKLWIKSGKNELLGQMINDELGRAMLKVLLGFGGQAVASEKKFAGSEYLLEISGLLLEGAGSDAAGPLMDMVTPLLSEFITAGKEIAELDITKLDGDKEEFDAEAAKKELEEFRNKKNAQKTATA